MEIVEHLKALRRPTAYLVPRATQPRLDALLISQEQRLTLPR